MEFPMALFYTMGYIILFLVALIIIVFLVWGLFCVIQSFLADFGSKKEAMEKKKRGDEWQ